MGQMGNLSTGLGLTVVVALKLRGLRMWGARCDCFDVGCMGSPAIIRLCCYIVYQSLS